MRALVMIPADLREVEFQGLPLEQWWDRRCREAGLSLVPCAEGAARGAAVVVDGRAVGLSRETLEGLREEPGAVAMPGRGAVAVALAGAGGGTCPEALRDPLDPIDLPAEERLWAGDAWELALAERALLSARLERLGRAGVRLLDPSRVYLEPSVVVEPGAFLGAGVELRGATVVRAGARVEAGCVLTDTTVEGGAVVLPYSVCEGAAIGAGAKVGPMAHLRTGAVLEARVKVGNFVEVKKSVLREGAKASHLTYIGDAEIGADANIGAGTITCNYDGFNKHRTVIGAGAFIGSNSSLVAPIEIGAGAIVGAGSTLSRQVPEDALAVERAEQRVLPDKARAIREKNRRLKEGGGA